MCEKVEDSDSQSIQHFISSSPWDAGAVLRKVASDTSDLFIRCGDRTGLIIDESGWRKQGKDSVGVARQYLGNIGKVDNGQVGVFAGLVQGNRVCITDVRLYLPEIWVNDRERCLKAGIPEDKIIFRTKPELALEMIRSAGKQGINFEWVGGDGFYGHDSALRYGLDDGGEFYILDIHSDERIYTGDPEPYVPAKKSGRGRCPKRYRTDSIPADVKSLAGEICESEWKEYCFRDGSKGGKRRQVAVREVWTWNGKDNSGRREKLIISRNSDGNEVKYSLCNDRGNRYSDADLLYMQMQRYWTERSFQDAKNELGMAEYQVRTWTGWHHHIALTVLAMLFMLTQRVGTEDEIPLLSCSDIRFIPANTLPRRVKTRLDILNIINERHIRRKRDIDRFR